MAETRYRLKVDARYEGAEISGRRFRFRARKGEVRVPQSEQEEEVLQGWVRLGWAAKERGAAKSKAAKPKAAPASSGEGK